MPRADEPTAEDETGELRSTWTVIDGLKIHARVSEPVDGRALPPIVLVHGLSVSSKYMIPVAEHLAPYYQVYAPDLPGFGKSDKPHHILNIAELADALCAYMDTVGVYSAPMLGNSLGCQIIVEFALRYPGRVTRAVLVGPTMDRYARTMWQQGFRLMLDSVREPWTQPFVVLSDYFKTGIRRTLKTLRYGLDDRIEDKLPRVDIPILVQRGGKDPIVSQRWAEEVAAAAPRGRLVVFDDTAHTANYSSPNKLEQVTRAFLAETE